MRIAPGRRTLLWAAALLAAAAFPWGPLFPWSPVHPGYAEVRTARATVLYPAGTELPAALTHVDEYIARAEKFHRLAMPSHVLVILCRSWGDFERFMPHMRGRNVGAVALVTGTVVYVTPRLAEMRFDYGEFLRHELSHAAVHQNQSPWNGLELGRQEWLAEGLATSFGEMKSFVTPEQFLERARKQDLAPVIDPDLRAAAPKPFDMRFAYQAWRFFVEHLIDTRGRDRFQRYLTACMVRPAEWRSAFQRTYGVPFGQAIRDFEAEIRNGWTPDAGFVARQL
jgi:hypothetical protein